jgi:undecaprenyl-diphosphatase
MDDFLVSAILGVVEGLTEFLPVSSTAHLRIVEAIFGISLSDGYWKMYSIVIQLGAILCLPIYFRARIAKFLGTFPRGGQWYRSAHNHPLGLVSIAFLFTAIPSFLLVKVVGKHLESLFLMSMSLIIGGVVMWIVDIFFSMPHKGHHKTERIEEMSIRQATWIGLCQVASALFPGTSRSMSTITAGQIAGISRPAALEFSFFLSMPTMIAATGYDLLRAFLPSNHAIGTAVGTLPANMHQWLVLLIGFIISFVVSFVVVAWFINWVQRKGLAPFAVYRIIFGIALIVWTN